MGRIPKANRRGYTIVEFDEQNRKEYLTGFQKRNIEKKKKAEERRKNILLKEQKRIRNEKQSKLKQKYEEVVNEVIAEGSTIQLDNHLITITPIDNMSSNGLHLGFNNLTQKNPKDENNDEQEKKAVIDPHFGKNSGQKKHSNFKTKSKQK